LATITNDLEKKSLYPIDHMASWCRRRLIPNITTA